MKNNLRDISIQKLKSAKTYFLVLMLVLLLPAFNACAQTISFGVTFGTQSSDGGPCVGSGVCKESFDLDSTTLTYISNPEAITTTFQLSPNNPNVLMMSFLLSDLQRLQPAQVNLFINTANSYPFSANYILANSAISQLNIPANAVISTTSPSTVMVSGNIVTDYITLATN